MLLSDLGRKWESPGVFVLPSGFSAEEVDLLCSHYGAELRRYSEPRARNPQEPDVIFVEQKDGPSSGVQVLTFASRSPESLPCSPLIQRFLELREDLARRLMSDGDPSDPADRIHLSVIAMRQGQGIEWHSDAFQVDPPIIAVLHLSRPGSGYQGGNFLIRPRGDSGEVLRIEAGHGDVVAFRWDAVHAVSQVTDGHRLVLSAGRIRRDLENGHHSRTGD